MLCKKQWKGLCFVMSVREFSFVLNFLSTKRAKGVEKEAKNQTCFCFQMTVFSFKKKRLNFRGRVFSLFFRCFSMEKQRKNIGKVEHQTVALFFLMEISVLVYMRVTRRLLTSVFLETHFIQKSRTFETVVIKFFFLPMVLFLLFFN